MIDTQVLKKTECLDIYQDSQFREYLDKLDNVLKITTSLFEGLKNYLITEKTEKTLEGEK